MRMWKIFLEPMLEISLCADSVEDIEEDVKVKALEEKGTDEDRVESGGGSEGNETSSHKIDK